MLTEIPFFPELTIDPEQESSFSSIDDSAKVDVTKRNNMKNTNLFGLTDTHIPSIGPR